MGWAEIRVASQDGEKFAAELLALANDPAIWTLDNMGAMVVRRQSSDGDHFYFSPHAAAVFAPLVDMQGAAPCDPPRTRELVKSQTSRMALGFKTYWQPFMPSRIAAAGIPQTSRKGAA